MEELKQYNVVFEPVVLSIDLKKISKQNKNSIKKAIETKLTSRPALYSLPLRSPLVGYKKLRVGKYRIVFKLDEENKNCIIIGIRHRENIYIESEKRV